MYVAVSLFTSIEAQFAMKSVAQWCTGRNTGASHWMTGWQLAKSTFTNPQTSTSSFIASSSRISTDHSKTSSWSSTDHSKTPSRISTDHSKTPSSTTLPLPIPLILKSIDISNEDVKMFVSSETHLYQVRLLQQARSRPEVIGKIVTLSATTVENFIAPPATKFEPCPDDEVRKHITKLLAIEANNLTLQMPYTLKRSLPILTTSMAIKMCASPLQPFHPPTHPSKTPSITPIPQPVSPVSDCSPSSAAFVHDLKTPSPCSLGSPSPIDFENTTPSTNVPATSSTHTSTTAHQVFSLQFVSTSTAAVTTSTPAVTPVFCKTAVVTTSIVHQASPLFYEPPQDCSSSLLYVPTSCATPNYEPITTMTSFRPVRPKSASHHQLFMHLLPPPSTSPLLKTMTYNNWLETFCLPEICQSSLQHPENGV
ncbi:mucin-5AC-like [Dreissena polymorpha]|uniref:Uncharacterized protein n=1 Tax=Dreissena polymorpha TaxID=45954 RepID=A0A9D4JUX3_DREPO|nr:mucin-5AC-like [Dreissena polymorpha]KAH3821433.1 hypothetical protein DPMN_123197 [Dreissena polymorpha]